jgi:hypothetical protein
MENRIVTAGIRPRGNKEYTPPATGEVILLLKNAFRQYYEQHGFDVSAKATSELMELLETGALRCRSVEYASDFTLPEETETEARKLCSVLRRQNSRRLVRAMLRVFADQEYDLLSSKHGALYYPALNLYVYCGYPSPNTLLRILREPDCEQAALFVSMPLRWTRSPRYLLFEQIKL